jgi:hypothetical protein
VVTRPRNLKKTLTVAFVAGSIFFAINQLGPILGGHASAVVLAKCVLNCSEQGGTIRDGHH